MLSFQQQVVTKQASQEHYFQLHAAMARLMKCHRTLRMEKLFELVFADMRPYFVPTSEELKASLSYLIENEMIRKSSVGDLEYIP
jgi:hypothetical protein